MEWMDASSRVVGSGTSLFELGGAEGKSPRDIHAKGGVSAQGGTRRRDEQGVNEDRTVYFFEFGVYFQLLLRDEGAVYFLENVV
ncbi:hypothetical protein VB005_04170 [Metarhizium brunneum]